MSWLDGLVNASIQILRGAIALPPRSKMSFGDGLTATDNPMTGATDISVDGTLPEEPDTSALVLQSTGAASTAWRPVAPTLVPSGGSDVAQITAGLTAAGHVALSVGTFQVNANTTIGSLGEKLHFYPGAKLKPASGVTITLACDIDAADDQHIFDRSAGGSVVFGSTGPQHATPDHFGAVRDGSTDDQPAIQAAHDALAYFSGGTLRKLPGSYAIAAPLVRSPMVDVIGAGRETTILVPLSSFSAMKWDTSPHPIKRTVTRGLQILFSGVENTITSGRNSSVGFELQNSSGGHFEECLVSFSGTSTQGGTGWLFNGDSAGGSPYYNQLTQPFFFGISDSNSIPFHFTYGGGHGANANVIVGGSVESCKCLAWFESAVENTIIGTTCQNIDNGSSYVIYGDGDGPNGAIGNIVRMGYYESAGTTYLVRYGTFTTSISRNYVEAVDNGITLIDPGGDSTDEGDNEIRVLGGSRVYTVTTTGGTTTAPSTLSHRAVVEVNGALGSDAIVEVPPVPGLAFAFTNQTSGAHTVKVRPTGGTGVFVVQGFSSSLYVSEDGSTVRRASPDVTDDDAGTVSIAAKLELVARADVLAIEKTDGTIGGTLAPTSGFLTWSSTGGMNILGTGGGSVVGFKADTINHVGPLTQFLDASLNIGGTIVPTGTGTIEYKATSSLTYQINSVQTLKLDTTGIGFYNHATAAQQSITGALSTVTDAAAKAVLTSIIAAGVATGLWTDGTT